MKQKQSQIARDSFCDPYMYMRLFNSISPDQWFIVQYCEAYGTEGGISSLMPWRSMFITSESVVDIYSGFAQKEFLKYTPKIVPDGVI